MRTIEAFECAVIGGGRSDGTEPPVGMEIPTHYPFPTCPVFRPPPES